MMSYPQCIWVTDGVVQHFYIIISNLLGKYHSFSLHNIILFETKDSKKPKLAILISSHSNKFQFISKIHLFKFKFQF